jgi:prevent-host-death family protein
MYSIDLQSYSLTDARNKHGEVFDRAAVAPVVLTKKNRPSYVVLSVSCYQEMQHRLQELEDFVFAEAAKTNLQSSQKIGADAFTAQLLKLAHGQG